MDDLESAIVNWVRFKQLNLNNLTTQINSLSDLSNGIALFELLSLISNDHFDISLLTLDTQSNWALKLSNLKRLKQGLDSYIAFTLKLPYEKINEVVLSNIARRAESEDILKLLEQVLFLVIHCHKKQEFIGKIMKLNQENQYSLMMFIKKIIGCGQDEEEEITTQDRQIELLRDAKKKLINQLNELQNEFNAANAIHHKILEENEKLKLSLSHLQNELDNFQQKKSLDASDVYIRIEKKLVEKTHMLEMMKQILQDTRQESEQTITKLKDELDIALSGQHKLHQSERTIEKYKRKLESASSTKIKYNELKKTNENMQQLIKKHQDEADSYKRTKLKIKELKDELAKEKAKSNMLSMNLDYKEKQNIKLTATLAEQADKIIFLQNSIQEIKLSSNNSPSEDVSYSERLDLEIDACHIELKPTSFQRLKSMPMKNTNFADRMLTENNTLRQKLDEKKAIRKELKESISMQYEDFLVTNNTNSEIIEQLTTRNHAMMKKLEEVNETISLLGSEKEIYQKMTSDNSALQEAHTKLLQEVKEIYKQKTEALNKCIELQDSLLKENQRQYEMRLIIQNLTSELRIAKDRIQEFEQITSKYESLHINNAELPAIELKQALDTLRNEYLRLEELNAELQRKFDELGVEKERCCKEIETVYKERIEMIKNEFNMNAKQTALDLEFALQQAQNDKDMLNARLKSEKKNSLIVWKQSMTIRDPSLNQDEAKRLRLSLAEVIKENEQLIRDNQELTICWKDSAIMLKEMKKCMDNETKRMHDIIRLRN